LINIPVGFWDVIVRDIYKQNGDILRTDTTAVSRCILINLDVILSLTASITLPPQESQSFLKIF